MAKVNFTAERIANFGCAPDKQQSIFWDAKTPGLGLRVTAAGAKSYIFETRLHGKTLRVTIGDVRTWAIGKAQAEATRLKTLTDQGIDPRQQKAEQRDRADAAHTEAKRRDLTLGDVWPIYIEARKSQWGKHHLEHHLASAAPGGESKKVGKGLTAPGPLASLIPLLLSDLTSHRIAEWLKTEAATRPTYTANSFRLLRAFSAWAADMEAYRGIVPEDAYNARIVRESLPKPKTREGDSLQREQLKVWFDAVMSLPNPVISAYLQGLLLTGARREELAELRWEDVDFQWRSMKIKDKVEKFRIIPLTPYVASLLQDLKCRNGIPPNVRRLRDLEASGRTWSPSPWVFSSMTAADGKLAEPRMAHNEALAIGGLPHLTIQGLRRSFGTLCEWVEVPGGISAQIMGHKPSALAEKHYRRRPLDLLRKWHDQIEAWILEQAGIEFVPEQPGLRVVTAA